MNEKNTTNVNQAKTLYSTFWPKSTPSSIKILTGSLIGFNQGLFWKKSSNCELTYSGTFTILSGKKIPVLPGILSIKYFYKEYQKIVKKMQIPEGKEDAISLIKQIRNDYRQFFDIYEKQRANKIKAEREVTHG